MQISRLLYERVTDLLAAMMEAALGEDGGVIVPIEGDFADTPALAVDDLTLFESTVDGPLPLDLARTGYSLDTGDRIVFLHITDGNFPVSRTEDDSSHSLYGWAVTQNGNANLWAWEKFPAPLTVDRTYTWLFPPRMTLDFPPEIFR